MVGRARIPLGMSGCNVTTSPWKVYKITTYNVLAQYLVHIIYVLRVPSRLSLDAVPHRALPQGFYDADPQKVRAVRRANGVTNIAPLPPEHAEIPGVVLVHLREGEAGNHGHVHQNFPRGSHREWNAHQGQLIHQKTVLLLLAHTKRLNVILFGSLPGSSEFRARDVPYHFLSARLYETCFEISYCCLLSSLCDLTSQTTTGPHPCCLLSY